MPEQKHYISDDLNTGYIYTNVQSIIVKKEEYNPNIIKQLKATRREIYIPKPLNSFYRARVDYGDITSSFTQVFDDEISKKIKLDEVFTELENRLGISGLDEKASRIAKKKGK
jgi:hypothetical protein